MITLEDLHCPICGNGAVKIGKGGLVLCLLHGWIKPVKAINLNAKAATRHSTDRRAER